MPNFVSRTLKKINASYWLRSGSYSLMSRVLVTLFGFVNFYILIRMLSKEDFGTWVLFISVASLMELIKHGFVRNAFMRYLALSKDEESPNIQTASFFLNVVIGMAEVILLLLCSLFLSEFWSSPALRSLFLIYMLSTSVLVPINHFEVIQQARMEFKGTFISNFVRHFGLFIFILISFASGFQIELHHLAYAQLVSIFISGFVSYRYAKPFLEFSRTINWKWFKELYRYGAFTFGTNVSSMILKSIDSWMLGKLISPAAVTIFNPAIRVSNLVEVPTDTLTSILFPKLSERLSKEGPQAAKYLYEKAVGTITAIMIPIVVFFIVFAEPIVMFIAGPGFEETVPILQVTMLYGLIIPFNRFTGITLDAIGKAKINFLFVLQNTIINAISNLIYIYYFGIIGAAYGTLTTYVIMLGVNQIYLHRHLDIRLKNVFRHIIASYSEVFSTGVKFLKGAF